ncbi:MAG: DUF1501 domain-containing protein [Chitinophagaceae bacterium]
MKRKDFLKLGGGASLAFMINGFPISTFASTPLLKLLAKQTQASGRVLVLIQLNGGNDGLNTLIPLDQYSALSSARSNILIPAGNVLSLTGTLATGLNPAMTGIRSMYNNGLVNIVQGVSYPNPNFSHFRATDIWNSGSDANQYLNTGWLGRYLEGNFSGFPIGYPNATMPDPLAIQIGSGVSPVLQGPQVSMGMAISDLNNFYNIVNGTVDPAPATPGGHELTFVRYISQQTQAYTTVIQAAANNSTTLSTQYAKSGNSLSDQLQIVARLIKGGLQTPVYVVSMGSFDTHSNQVDSTDHTIGTQANLLGQLSTAVSAFYDDLKLMGVDNRVAAMTFSEFGRRIISNASGGTDHGTSEPVFVFGPGVNPGIIGSNPTIPANATVNDNLAMQMDYRSVYSAVLADWFGMDPTVLTNALLQSFTIPPIFRKETSVGGNTVAGSIEILGQNYPNPMQQNASIDFTSDGGLVTIQLFDANGRLLHTLAQQTFPQGVQTISINRGDLPAGIYFYRLTSKSESATRQMLVVD